MFHAQFIAELIVLRQEQEWCDEFKACNSINLTFMDLVSQPSTPADSGVESTVDDFGSRLEEVCSEDSLRTLDGIQQCHDKCQTHLCCFTEEGFLAGDGHCDDVHIDTDSCAAYTPCKRLVILEEDALADDSMPLADVADSVENVCTPDDPAGDWVANCHAICAQRLCCFLDANIGSNCRDAVGSEECAAYAPCESLIDGNKGQVTSDPTELVGIENVCDGDLVDLNSRERNACEALCQQRSCCFEDEVTYSCYNMVSL